MAEFDPGPTNAFATHWDNRPSYASVKARFRMNWGPIYYRGRLDGSAKVIIIGQDPAADENVARRILVGSAGQRVQGFLRKLGINKSYVMVNTFLYGLKGQIDAEAKTISASASIKNWRNQLLDMLKTGQTQAVIAFGTGAHQVVDLWPGVAGLFVAKPLHPSFRDDAGLRDARGGTRYDALRREHVQEGGSGEYPRARFPVWRTEVDGHRRHGVANLADADRVEVTRGGWVDCASQPSWCRVVSDVLIRTSEEGRGQTPSRHPCDGGQPEARRATRIQRWPCWVLHRGSSLLRQQSECERTRNTQPRPHVDEFRLHRLFPAQHARSEYRQGQRDHPAAVWKEAG